MQKVWTPAEALHTALTDRNDRSKLVDLLHNWTDRSGIKRDMFMNFVLLND
jgi:hypothetical protein